MGWLWPSCATCASTSALAREQEPSPHLRSEGNTGASGAGVVGVGPHRWGGIPRIVQAWSQHGWQVGQSHSVSPAVRRG